MSDLQSIAESLGTRLQRSVAIDDPRMRLLAYSPHYGPIDDTRLTSILCLQAPAPAAKYVLSHGIARAVAPLRLPADPLGGLLPRVCAPIRCQQLLLGYLWLIDAEQSLTDADLEVVARAADDAGQVMYRQQLLNELSQGRQRELIRDLLSADQLVRDAAARELLEGDSFVADHPVAVAYLEVSSTGETGEALRLLISAELERARHRLPPRNCLHMSRLHQGVIIAAPTTRSDGQRDLFAMSRQVQEGLIKRLPAGSSVVIGVGGPAPTLAEAQQSYRQAELAVRVGRQVPEFGTIVDWAQLGVYRILAALPPSELTSELLHPGLLRLLDADSTDLLCTLETYLDLAGDARATSDRLSIHRTSLYYRLNRIQEITGVDLADGADRLSVHLGLKIARLAGLRTAV